MSITDTIVSGLLTGVEIAFPAAAPFIEIAKRIAPYAVEAFPIVKAAITEGPAAFEAAKKVAPDFFSGLQELADKIKVKLTGDPAAFANDHELAIFSAHIVGIDPPGWTHADTQRWWDKADGAH